MNIDIETIKKAKSDEVEQGGTLTHNWTQEEKAVLFGNVALLKNTADFKKDPEAYINKAQETYCDIKDFFISNNAKYFEDVNELYHIYTSQDSKIVRREDPLKVLRIVNGESLEINFDPEIVGDRGDKYANCALWPHGAVNKTSGLANAFLEGRGMAGPIVLLAGYTKSPEMNIDEPSDKMLEVGSISRENVKILSGMVKKEDIDFVILRMAIKFFDQNELTDQEKKLFKEGKISQIFRGFQFK